MIKLAENSEMESRSRRNYFNEREYEVEISPDAGNGWDIEELDYRIPIVLYSLKRTRGPALS